MRILSTALLLLSLVAPLGGCTSSGGGGDGDPTVSFEIGGSSDEGEGFVDWSAGDATPPMIRGPQGGQHVWVSVRARGLWPKKARVAIEMFLDETGVVVKPGRVPITANLHPEDPALQDAEPDLEAWYGFEGITAFVRCPCQVQGKRFRVVATIEDLYGADGTDEAYITPTWDGSCTTGPSPSCEAQ